MEDIQEHPLADGGMSPVYGRDEHGPTAVLKSVSDLIRTGQQTVDFLI